MRSWELIIVSVVTVVLIGVAPGQAQTGIAELQTTMSMMETLDEASTGPPPSTVRRAAGQPGAMAAPAQPSPGEAVSAAAAAPPGESPGEAESEEVKPPITKEGDEGTPFSFTSAAKFANQGMAHLRTLQFNEAVEAYRQAKEIDERYTDFYEKAVELRDKVNKDGLEGVKTEKVKEDLELTWGQFLGWERQPVQIQGYPAGGAMGPYPGMSPMGPYPGMGPAGPAGMGGSYPPGRSGKF